MSIFEAVTAALGEADTGSNFDQAANRIISLIGTAEGLLEFTRSAACECQGAHPVAYLHSNGFLKIEYLRSGLVGLRVRGHFWNSAWGSVRQNPHNHAFDFHSRVVLGTFSHRHFSRMPEGEGRLHFGYRYNRAMRDGVDSYCLEKTDTAWLAQWSEELISTGTEYVMLGDQLHALDPLENGIGATAVVSRPYNDRPWSEVYSLNQSLHLTPRNSRLLDRETMVEFVESVLTDRKLKI